MARNSGQKPKHLPAAANLDTNYLALRNGTLTKVFRVQNLTIERDLGKLTFQSGTFDFLEPVLGHVIVGVFVGEGVFRLKPAFSLDQAQLTTLTGQDEIQESFRSAVLCFTDDRSRRPSRRGAVSVRLSAAVSGWYRASVRKRRRHRSQTGSSLRIRRTRSTG